MSNNDRQSLNAPEEVSRWQSLALGIGALATIAWLIGCYFNTEQALRSWLLGFVFWGGISIGFARNIDASIFDGRCLGRSNSPNTRSELAKSDLGCGSFAPIMLGIVTLYHWATAVNDPIIEWRHIYLNPTSFGLRTILYFALWFVMAYLLNKWSAQQDKAETLEEAAGYLETATRFSGPTLVIFALVVTFASIDWTMSLDKHWFQRFGG